VIGEKTVETIIIDLVATQKPQEPYSVT